jgi:hypothetical protein
MFVNALNNSAEILSVFLISSRLYIFLTSHTFLPLFLSLIVFNLYFYNKEHRSVHAYIPPKTTMRCPQILVFIPQFKLRFYGSVSY